jgi:peptidoglycan hydrolase-like protein with peptidoglycan-binding domain
MARFTRSAAERIAIALACDPNFVLAVADVESGGRSDLPDGRPQILFEAQWFHKFTGGLHDATHPTISSPSWNKALYRGGAAEYERLAEAEALNHTAALKSASWGLFQIMGFNFDRCDFSNVDDFVAFLRGPDNNDMEAFIRFVKADARMLHAMQVMDSFTFALLYNGPGQPDYYKGKIDASMAAFAAGADVHQVNDIAAIQAKLGVPVDGTWGKVTHAAVIAFQCRQGLTPDGIVGPQTRAALHLDRLAA